MADTHRDYGDDLIGATVISHDWGGELTLRDSILEGVAVALGLDSRQLPPFREATTVDAMDEMFASAGDAAPTLSGKVVFDYADCSITVHHDGTVRIDPLVDGPDATGR